MVKIETYKSVFVDSAKNGRRRKLAEKRVPFFSQF